MQVRDLLVQLWRAQRGLLVFLAVLVLANLGGYLLLQQSLAPHVVAAESRYIQRQAEVRQLLRNKGGLTNSPEQQFILASQDLAEFDLSIPVYAEFTGLIDELVELSTRAGLKITQVNYKPEQDRETRFLRYALTFDVNGKYEQLKTFIHALEQSPRLLIIRGIGLQSSEEGNVILRLSIETFFRPEGSTDES